MVFLYVLRLRHVLKEMCFVGLLGVLSTSGCFARRQSLEGGVNRASFP